jgi:hypothetical protein
VVVPALPVVSPKSMVSLPVWPKMRVACTGANVLGR